MTAPDTPENDSHPAPLRSQRRAQAAADSLRTLIRDQALRLFGAVDAAAAAPLEMNLRFTVQPSQAWALTFDPALDEQVQAQLEDRFSQGGAFQRGRVYCFRCAGAGCDHAVPPTPLCVFNGYSPTGMPEWCEMAQALIDARDERVDQLFASHPALLARVQMGRELRARQLTPFGHSSRTYALLGQVAAGYFPLPSGRGLRPAERSPRLAVSLQVAEIRDARGRMRLELNPVSALSPDDWREFVLSDEGPAALGPAIDRAGRALEDLGGRVAAARLEKRFGAMREALQGIPAILGGLARAIERGARQDQRRTRHAQRHPRQERPVHKAWDDAREAPQAGLFYDEKRNTWVVCARQGRTHAFNEQGRHVTSFTLEAGAVEFRVRTRRWRAATPAEFAAFREKLEAPPLNDPR